MANPKGEIIERPVKANFMEGLDVIEYFTSTHGARKGLADTALRTADSGYLTRRLVDVAQDVIIRIEDCGTKEFLETPLFKATGEPEDMLVGRVAAADVKDGKTTIVAKGEEIARETLAAIVAANQQAADANGAGIKIPVRSVLKCEATVGVCQKCYGRALATGKTAMIGDAVGIVAAQSIGEPGTQLTMRTFHTGGVAGADITHGLPRVVELFEARKPKGLAKIAEVSGVVSVEDTDKARTIVVTDEAGEEHRYPFPRRTRLHVAEGEVIEAGKQLNEGSLYPHELLDLRGRTATEVYLVKEVQEVYKSQGVDIHDKHIELIVRQMLKKVRVEQKGDTDLLPGQFVDRHEFRRINEKVQAAGGEPAHARRDHPRHHQGLAGHGLLPLGGLLPGDHEGPHRRGARGQDRPPRGPEGERDHRQADPGRHRAQALPLDRDRAVGAAAPRHRRRRPARGRRPRRRARARRRRRPAGLRPGLRHDRAGRDQRRLRPGGRLVRRHRRRPRRRRRPLALVPPDAAKGPARGPFAVLGIVAGEMSTPAEVKARLDAERRGGPFLLYRDGDGAQVIVLPRPRAADRRAPRRSATSRSSWDTEVSRLHAQLEPVGRDWIVVDDGLSRNGTYVNGERVSGRRRLCDGDRLVFGETPCSSAPRPTPRPNRRPRSRSAARTIPLSEGQRKVLVALCRPLKDSAYATPATNKDIADEVHLTVDAVKAHLRVLFERFGLDELPQNQKRARLAAVALVNGVVRQHEF